MKPTCILLAVFGPLFASPVLSSAAESKPLITVLLLIDDLGWRDIGCNGSTYYRTPNIDRLAAEGVQFADAYAVCAVCSPTRAAILTGKYPARLLLTDWLPSGQWDPRAKPLRGGSAVPCRSRSSRWPRPSVRRVTVSPASASGTSAASPSPCPSITASTSTSAETPPARRGTTSSPTTATG